MTIEVATYINDLQPVNPPSTDPVSQGDDHIRLLKTVLQNTLVGASRQWQVPGTLALSTSTAITKANGESTVYVSTAGGAVTLTLPTLVALDAGWKVHFIKTSSDANPMFIAPASGTINSGGIAGLAKARRCIPAARITAIWDGANWFVTRALTLPIGSLIEYWGSVLPAGYEWPSGQTLASVATNYPEYNAIFGTGVTPDKRGRPGIPLDNLGGVAAGRLGAVINGTAVGNTGGVETVTLAASQLPTITSSGSNSVSVTSSVSNVICGAVVDTAVGAGAAATTIGNGSGSLRPFSITSTGSVSISSSSTNTTGGAHSNLQPSIMVGQLLVVE